MYIDLNAGTVQHSTGVLLDIKQIKDSGDKGAGTHLNSASFGS